MKVVSDVRPALASTFEVAGRFLLVDTSDEVTASSIRRFLSRWELSPVLPGIEVKTNATIVVRVGPAPPIPADYEKFPLVDGATGFASDIAHQIVFADGSVLAADESTIVHLWLPKSLESDNPLLAQLVSHSLSAALRRSGVFELHSGAVTKPATSESILICGPSGSGKSTLTLQFMATGWSYLSDDVVLLSMEKEKVKATGLRRFFALTRQTIEGSGLPEVSSLVGNGPTNDSGKRRLDARELFPSGVVEECRPNVIFFPMITADQASWTRELTPAETMSRLIRLCPWSCYDRAVAREFLDVLAKLVKQSVSFDLLAGNDLMGDPHYTSNFLTAAVKARTL
ncbi:MAG TPA: ATP-binding protein [Pyrinomonadaceae bacterium]|jgi:hypothetical protein